MKERHDLYDDPTLEDPFYNKPHPLIRFAARYIDMTLFYLIIFNLISMPHYIQWTRQGYMIHLFVLNMILYIVLEAWLLSSWGYTPGKFLLKVRVRTLEGNKMPFPVAMTRSFLVLLFGCGLNFILLQLPFYAISYYYLHRNKRTGWDAICRLDVYHEPVSESRVGTALLIAVLTQAILTHYLKVLST